MEQSAVASAQAHQGIVDSCVSVGIELHGSPYYVGAFGAAAPQQMHLVHGVQQLAVAGLEAVDLRNGPGDDDGHGVRHIVDFQRLGNGLLQHLGLQAQHIGVVHLFRPILLGGFFLCQIRSVLIFRCRKGRRVPFRSCKKEAKAKGNSL